jgi:hypothetical protein
MVQKNRIGYSKNFLFQWFYCFVYYVQDFDNYEQIVLVLERKK